MASVRCSPPESVKDMDERVRRAFVLAGDKRLRAAALLDRWASTIGAMDPTVAADLRRSARRLVRRDLVGANTGTALSRAKNKHPRLSAIR